MSRNNTSPPQRLFNEIPFDLIKRRGSNEKERLKIKKIQMGPFPMEFLSHVDKPTSEISEGIQRIDMRNTAYGLAERGEYGSVVQKGVQNSLPGKYPLSASQKDILVYIALMAENPVAKQVAPFKQDADLLTRHIKSVGYFLKADIVGTCQVPHTAYYSHDKLGNPIETRYQNAVVIVMRKELQAVRSSSGHDWMGDPISFQAYQHLGMVAETIANYIRRLGWASSAQYGPSFVDRYSVLLPPLLLAAGIGEISRTGIILNPYLGLAFKAAVVLTDMPVIPDKPIDFGLQNFCQDCKICAEVCPSKAIPTGDKVMYNGYETWKLDTRRCASFNFTNKKGTMCNTCVKYCPWSNPSTWPHGMIRNLITKHPFTRHTFIKLAKYQKSWMPSKGNKWWFDMEYIDDVIDWKDTPKNE